jgi:hypothetical protein
MLPRRHPDDYLIQPPYLLVKHRKGGAPMRPTELLTAEGPDPHPPLVFRHVRWPPTDRTLGLDYRG